MGVVVWINNLILPAGARVKTPRARLLVNWGTGDSNIGHRQALQDVDRQARAQFGQVQVQGQPVGAPLGHLAHQ